MPFLPREFSRTELGLRKGHRITVAMELQDPPPIPSGLALGCGSIGGAALSATHQALTATWRPSRAVQNPGNA